MSLLVFMTVLFGQACTHPYFHPVDSEKTSAANNSGNGTTYDGKLTFLEFEADFKCENKIAAKSIITRENGVWTLLKNSPQKCAESVTVLNDVTYSGSSNFLNYNGINYALNLNPATANSLREFKVDPTASTNSLDSTPGDGVCADSSGKCSLQAAFDELNGVDLPAIINIPNGTYFLSSTLKIKIDSTVQIVGASSSNTILDGGSNTAILETAINSNNHPTRVIKGLNFSHAFSDASNASGGASAISVVGSVRITGCQFHNNTGFAPAVLAGVFSHDVIVEDSVFDQTQNVALLVHGSSLFSVLRSEFSGNATGLIVDNSTWNVTIKGSSFYNNTQGIIVWSCYSGCLIENTTVANNFIGIYISTVLNNDFYIRNTTVKGYNLSALTLRFDNSGSTGRLFLQNSILSNSLSGQHNCSFLGTTAAANLVAQNSIVDDTSCGTAGIQITDPLLQALALNGGTTHTMLPNSGSPAIDSGDNLICSAKDQRGAPRPVDKLGNGAICDIGAVEVQ